MQHPSAPSSSPTFARVVPRTSTPHPRVIYSAPYHTSTLYTPLDGSFRHSHACNVDMQTRQTRVPPLARSGTADRYAIRRRRCPFQRRPRGPNSRSSATTSSRTRSSARSTLRSIRSARARASSTTRWDATRCARDARETTTTRETTTMTTMGTTTRGSRSRRTSPRPRETTKRRRCETSRSRRRWRECARDDARWRDARRNARRDAGISSRRS